jgi:hypothetical protein
LIGNPQPGPDYLDPATGRAWTAGARRWNKMKNLLSLLVLLVAAPPVALAGLVDATKSSIVPADALHGVVLCPDTPSPTAATNYTVTIRNTSNVVVPGISISFEFPPPTNIKFCTTAVNSGTTGTSGTVVVTLRGGGCQRTSGSTYAVVVKANGVVFRTYYYAKSPDFDGVNPSGAVDLSDLLAYRGPVGCHDYDNTGDMTLSDTLIFAPGYQPKHSCTFQQ